MSVGFVTASGKDVMVSEKALQKARHLFELLDSDENLVQVSTGNIDNTRCNNAGNDDSLSFNSFFNTAPRNSKRISSTFKSPVVKNPRLDNVSCNSSFNSPTKKIAITSEQPTHTTRKNSLCGKIGNITPIKLLTPYCKNWRLCIKVTSVDEASIRYVRGQQIFSFLAVDDGGVEIRISAFGDIACRTADLICLEQMYYITRASVKMASRKYSRNQYDMEIILQTNSEITECTDRPLISSPKVNFEFVRIHNLQNFIDTEIDVLGIVINIGEMKQLKSKIGEELQKREIQIVDDSSYYVPVTLWGQKAKIFPKEYYQHVLAVKGLLVRCFQETISLVSMASSKLLHDPHFPEADALRFWYSENKDKTFKPVSVNQTLSFHEHKWIKQLKSSLNGHFFNLTAMISSIFTENAVYKGCLTCKKKLLVEKDGDLHICSKCGICNEYKYYYTLHMELFDFTGIIHVTAFDECAQKLIGEQADETPAKTEQIYFWSMKDFKPMPFDNYCSFLKNAIELASAEISVGK
ncbi:Replication factor a 1 [Dirofilaria immitis]|nr:Replication factor a 1 [Dirofilaria immitis]